jgi:hypothetical protein
LVEALSLRPLFCSIGLYACFYASTILFGLAIFEISDVIPPALFLFLKIALPN